jgi:exodeoxyribonuclease V beta subunit
VSATVEEPAWERAWERPAVLETIDLGAHAIIEASAGSGKTYTLEHLVLELVARGAPIEEILVVTFTDKATREMRQRVRARLVASRAAVLATGASSRLAARLGAAVAGFDRAPISTIHAFCQRALAEHAFASGRPFAFQRTDGRESFGHAWRQLVRTGLAGGAALRPGQAALRSALTAMAARGDGAVGRLEALLHTWMLEPGEVRPPFEAVEAARALLAMPTTHELVADAALAPRWAELLSEIPSLTARARVRDALIELATALGPHREALELALAEGRDVADTLAWGPALAWASSSTDPRGLETNVALCARHLAALGATSAPGREVTLEATLRVLHRSLGSPVPYLVATVLPQVKELWAREKRDAASLDFDDMLTALRDAVVRDPAVRRALRARHRHALVDEFQDTDEVQWEIFRRLFVEPDEEAGPDEAGRTLVVIGDVKQAIYGFRSADVHTFEDACRDLEARGARRAALMESYRSSAAMLEGLDRVFAGRPDEPSLARGLAGYEHPLRAGLPGRRALGEDGSEAPAIVVQHLVGAPELRLPLIRRALADAIAKECRALVAGGLGLVDDAEAAPRPVRLSEIFVLTRSASEGLEVAEAFRRQGVPHAFFKQDGLFRTREAREVLEVLRALADRHDRNLTTRALLGPFFGVPLRELPAAHAIDSGHPLSRRLTRWAGLAAEGRIAALFTAMLEGSGLSRRELYLHQGERALVNYRHLLELLLALAIERRLHVGELALELSRRIERAEAGASGDDEDVQKLESERDAVQILTMHKSKGLEAEVVFVLGGLGKPPKRRLAPRVVHERAEGGRARRVAWAVADDGLAETEISVDLDGVGVPLARALEREAREEDERLYYVAMTRAKRRLYLPYFGSPPRPMPRRDDVAYDPPHLKGSYRVLNDRLRALAEAGELVGGVFSVQTIEVGPRVRARATASALPAPAPAREAAVTTLPAQERARLCARYAGFEVTSYTRMKALSRARGALEADGRGAASVELAPSLALLAGEVPLESPGASGPGGARFGVLVHGVIEDVLEARASALDAASLASLPSVEARMATSGATSEERNLALELASRALRTPIETPCLSLPMGLAHVERRAVEMPFLFPVPERSHPPLASGQGMLVVERGFVRGVIDVLFEHEGLTYVLDWKTDRLPSYDEPTLREHVEEDYRVQIALYTDRKSTRLNSSHNPASRMPSSA